jgi:hypothetical protein
MAAFRVNVELSLVLLGPPVALALVILFSRNAGHAERRPIILFVSSATVLLVADVIAGKLVLGPHSVAVAIGLGCLAALLGAAWLVRRAAPELDAHALDR